MEKTPNATYLFDRFEKDQLPPCSESFWTTLFALFILHLGQTSDGKLRVFQTKEPAAHPWYDPIPVRSVTLSKIAFDDLIIEPQSLSSCFSTPLSVQLGGFETDVFMRMHDRTASKPKYLLVEVKTGSSASLQENQLSNYPGLVTQLNKQNIDTELLLLLSVGANDKLYKQTKDLEKKRDENFKFGLLLWEDILRQMAFSNFSPSGIDTGTWAKNYTQALQPSD